jgi:hypothetical protein
VGDLVVDLPPFGPTFHRDVRLSAKTAFRAPSQLHQFGFGPNLEYHLAIYYRGIGEFGGGPPVRVQFRRTGGIQVTPENWEQTTDGFGRVAFFVRAHEYGVLRGDVTIIPPAPFRTYTVTDLALETYDVDGAKLYDDYGVGPGLPYYVVIRRNGTPIPGVPVGFRRTGGIELNPAEFERATNDTGIVMLTSTPAGEGEVVGDITVRPPAPHPTFVVRGVRLQAIDGDPPGGRILIGDWDVTAPPATARVERP